MDHDTQIRMAAFAQCSKLMHDWAGAVPWKAIQQGLELAGDRIYLGSTPRGIHRPTQMRRGVLSIKTTKPKRGRTARYDDALTSDGLFVYAFQGDDPGNHDNQALQQSFEDQSPLIYFYGLTPAVYQILFPCYIAAWDPGHLSCTVAVGSQYELRDTSTPRVREIDRRYSTVEAKVRLHQAEFRELVLTAYRQRCAISGLPIPDLLDAAHILPDRDERGRPEISNGLCLSKLHHTAYDRNLLGIDPDGIIHISDEVLAQSDGPTLEMAIKGFNGAKLRVPRHAEDQPNRDYLAERFEAYKRAS